MVCDSKRVLARCGPSAVYVGTVLCVIKVVCAIRDSCVGIEIGLEIAKVVGREEERPVLSIVVVLIYVGIGSERVIVVGGMVVGGLVVGGLMVGVVVAEVVRENEDAEAIVCQAESRKK